MRRLYWVLLFLCLLCSGTRAASLEQINGEVLVNQGSGYRSMQRPIVVAPGDRVMAGPDASARIAYDAHCSVLVHPGSMVTVASRSPCANLSDLAPPSGLGGCSLKSDPRACHIEPEREDIPPLLIGAATLGLAVGGLILLEDDDKPASP